MSRTGPLHVLIDGHNVIHQDGELRLLMGQPEEAHREFEQLLSGIGRVTIFYDGGPGAVTQTLRRAGATIDYSGALAADDRIVRWLLFNPNVKAVVFSDDRALGARVRALGARPHPAVQLLERARSRRDSRPGSGEGKPQAALSPAEVDEWMRIFGCSDEQGDTGSSRADNVPRVGPSAR